MAAEAKTLGRYQLGRVLGKGAMGSVCEALDPKLHRKVAIKTILMGQLDEETAKDFSVRFEREARAVARLNHPNIVQVYDFGEEGDTAYLVMELIDGKELKSALTTGRPFDRKECVRIMCELLDALDFAHEAKVIHRDIKPANVMFDSQGRTKLTDFGVARVTDADRTSAERTQAGTVVGTPAYMSPEQLQGLPIDRRTDVFSAGVILYQFLTGQKPFTGEGAWTVQKKIVQDEPPAPSSINVALSPEFDRVVAKALAKDPNQRFATARQFAEALRRAAEGKPAVPEAEPTLVVPRDTSAPQATHPEALRSGEMELEFWRCSFPKVSMRRSRHARPPSCAAAPLRTTAAPAPWQEPTGRGCRGASRAPKPSTRRRTKPRRACRSKGPSSSRALHRTHRQAGRNRCWCRVSSGYCSFRAPPPISL